MVTKGPIVGAEAVTAVDVSRNQPREGGEQRKTAFHEYQMLGPNNCSEAWL